MNRTRTVGNHQDGFTIMQMVVTVAIIAVLSTLGFMGIANARAEFRLQSSARLFATYVEKARADAVRRHAMPGNESSVETFGPGTNTYTVSMDYGSGTVESRTFQLESGLTFNTAAKRVLFDWRGRIQEAWVFQVFSESLKTSLPVDVSGSGDITVGEQHFPDGLIPAVEISEVTGDTIPDPTPEPEVIPSPDPNQSPTATPTPTPSPNGNGNGNGSGGGNGNGNPNSTPTPTPTPYSSPTPLQDPGATPTPTPVMPQCVSAVSPSSLSLSQSVTSRQSGAVTFTLSNASGVRVLNASQAGGGNALNISMSLVRIEGNGSSVVSISTKHGAGNRGVFIVEISASPSCGGPKQVPVSVSN
jgi:Tfp pilus assembly protein PilE